MCLIYYTGLLNGEKEKQEQNETNKTSEQIKPSSLISLFYIFRAGIS
ncbi:MAG: hypothetical protein LBE18_12955 [Planctomycetaceae bacterium]|nr:hypothetical protein [Planctomycetaceae bacterium]